MAWLAAFPVLLLLLALFGMGLNAIDGAARENRLVASQLRSEQMYREALDTRTKEIRRFRHDVAGLLQAIEFAGKVNGEEAVPGRAAAPSQDGSVAIPRRFSEAYPLVTAIIELKHIQCAENGVTFHATVSDDFIEAADTAEVAESDLCALAQNLLENAYEANLLVHDSSSRAMRLLMSRSTDGKFVEVSNRTASSERPSFRTNKAHPESHGVGLASVKKVAAEYGAEPLVSFDPHARTLTVRVDLGRRRATQTG